MNSNWGKLVFNCEQKLKCIFKTVQPVVTGKRKCWCTVITYFLYFTVFWLTHKNLHIAFTQWKRLTAYSQKITMHTCNAE